MKAFNRRTAIRIAAVSTLLAAIAAPVAWFVSLESEEESIVALATEESRDLLSFNKAMMLNGPEARVQAAEAARNIVSGLFDIAEIYSSDGVKLAEALTSEGENVEAMLPKHAAPNYTEASYESLHLPGERWVLRVFIPLRPEAGHGISGYFEGVRVVPEWQKAQVFHSSLIFTLIAVLAALLCGAALYPVMVHLSADNERKAREVLDSHISMMEALGRAIAKRDSDTGAHNYRVAWIASRIAEKMGLAGKEMQSLIAGSFLHDVGKIGIPDAILLKPGKLDAEEFAVMRTHVQQGEEIVRGMGWLDGAHEVVAGHHEKWNGTGYPRQLAGEAIPLAARIFAVADVFDALCSKRPYKQAMAFEQAMAILEKDSGTHFDPAVMQTFAAMAAEIHQRLQLADEDAARYLLEERVREYFSK
jgi:HD-GYP domain-containing protein (c-di-GMP phosphodiesterase class II)